MTFKAAIIADSVNPSGNRLTTMELTYPRIIHSEVLTHRDRARNSASSRAIPWPKMMERISTNPFIPIEFCTEQKGMQTGVPLSRQEWDAAEAIWLEARDNAVDSAKKLAALGVHKSIVNRLTEPFMWITVIMTATEWSNFFRIRVHPDAEIHFQKIAGLARNAIERSTPTPIDMGGWHHPYVDMDEAAECLHQGIDARQVSVARCARVSYLTHDGKRDLQKDVELFDRLVSGSGFGHWSAHEHVAMAATSDVRSGPYRGWVQYRKTFPLECA